MIRFLAPLIVFFASAVSLAKVSYTIEGAETHNVKNLKSIITDNLTDSLDWNKIQKALNEMYATGAYTNIEVLTNDQGQGDTEVIFKMIPLRVIKSIQFVGNLTFSAKDLTQELGISSGDGYDGERAKIAVENIKKYYNLNGYLNAQVKADFQNIPESHDFILSVHVQEGEPCKIEELEFLTANPKLNRRLQDLFHDKYGKIFSQSLLNSMQNDITNYLFGDQYFSATALPPEVKINSSETGVKLSYTINNPFEYSLLFTGNEIFNDARLKKELKLDASGRLSSMPVEDITERLYRFYKKNGYAKISISHTERDESADYTKIINFSIQEGPRIKIQDIQIEGSFSRPEKYYRNFIKTHSSDLIDSGFYSSEDFETGVRNLVIDLQNDGFISAKVTGTRADFDVKRSSVTLNVTLEEGPQTWVKQILFSGNKSIPSSELEKVIGLSPQGPLRLSVLEDSSSRIVDYYRNLGYLNAQVLTQGKSVISYSADNTQAKLTFEISEGPLITVGSIVIEGNDFTKDYVILRELRFHEGEILTPEKISYSEQRLQRLSLFGSADIHVLEDDATEGKRTVIVKVEERPPGVFRSGVGVNNDLTFTVKGYVGADYRNLFGTGRGISSRVEIQDKTQFNFIENIVGLSYTEPFIFGTENNTSLNLQRSTRLLGIDDSSTPGTTYVIAADTSQADVVLQRDLTRYLKLSLETYGIAHINYYDIYNQKPATPLDVGTFGPSLTLDFRNDIFTPTHGSVSSLSLEFSNPYLGSTSTVNYVKTEAGHTQYTPLFGGITWANEVKGGYVKNLSPLVDGNIPAFKSFVLGGGTTLRGFNGVNETIPQIGDFPQVNGFYVVPIEEWYTLAKTEFRIPLVGNLGTALFYDGGAVRFPGFTPRFSWRDDVGLGLRYNTPVGPVSVEYAFKLNRDEGAQEGIGAFFFSIGVF